MKILIIQTGLITTYAEQDTIIPGQRYPNHMRQYILGKDRKVGRCPDLIKITSEN